MSTKEMIKPIIVLAIICLCLSAILALTNSKTAPIIEEAERAAAEAARSEVLPAADAFTEVTGNYGKRVVGVYKANNGEGYVVQILEDGYGGAKTLSVMVGIDKDGLISASKVLKHSETAGLGSRVAEDEFRTQFDGMDAGLEGFTAISGATISSGHYRDAIADAFEACEIAKEAN